MDTIVDFITPFAPVAQVATVAQIQRLFARTPEARVLAVAEGDQVVGVVMREAVLAAAPEQAVTAVLQAAAMVLDAATPPLEAARRLAHMTGRGNDAFLVTDGTTIIGCGELRDLLDGLCRDDPITSTVRAAEAAMRPEQRFKEDFLALISRELRAPMDGVLAMTELLERQPLTSDAQAQVRAIREAGDTLRRLLGEAADYTLAEQGLLQVQRQPVVLRTVLDDLQARWQGRIDRDGVTLPMSYDGDPELAVLTDPARLEQIFDSLIEPALAHTPAGSVEVTLKASASADGVHIEGRVRDTGPGLEADKLARVFEPGRADAAGGSCLGVALARQLVLALNGCIRAESNVGAGVTMLFDLLCEPAARQREDAEPTVNAGAAHVLVVDDNATNRMVAEALVEMFDCTSECAQDGLEAVEIARSGRFDVILMDIKMPRMDGMAATRAIRALPGDAGAVPIIALTANVDADDARAYLAAGMCAVVEKPIKPDRLLQAINDALAGVVQGQSAAA